MTAEGRIAVDLFPNNGAVEIASTRPLTITAGFSGHRPADVIRTVSLLFVTCRVAQSIASMEAFEDALGHAPPEHAKKRRALLVLTETAREHSLRILMDWPQFLRSPEPPQAAFLKRSMQIDRDLSRAVEADASRGSKPPSDLQGFAPSPCPTPLNPRQGDFARERVAAKGPGESCFVAETNIACLTALLTEAMFGEEPERFAERCSLAALSEWASSRDTAAARLFRELLEDDLCGAGASEIAPLPHLDRAALAERLFAGDAGSFIAEPDWQGRPRETSPLSRCKGHPLIENLRTGEGYGLMARLAACLLELSQIPGRMAALLNERDDSPAHAARGDGIGVAQIEAARGRLVHAVEMAGETVGRYRILAPTEWNFHPRGAAASGLRRIAADGGKDCAALARLFVTAVDPCVGVDVRVH